MTPGCSGWSGSTPICARRWPGCMEERDARSLVRLVGSLWPFWEEHAHYREARRWLEAALDLEGEAALADRLRALTGAGTMAWQEGDFTQAMRWHEQALTLARELGDRRAEAPALNNLGVQAMELGENGRAAVYFEASLAVARASAEPRATMVGAAQSGPDRPDATGLGDGRGAARGGGGAGPRAGGNVDGRLRADHAGAYMLDGGDPRRAAALLGEGLGLAHERGNVGGVIDALEGLARWASRPGRRSEAARLFGATGACVTRSACLFPVGHGLLRADN